MRSAARGIAPPNMRDELALGRLGDFVGFRLRRIQNQLSRDFATKTADRNLRSGLFSSLALISANPGVSQNELSKHVGLDKSVTVNIVDDLERRGWATRERSPVDRRRHALFVTEEGEAELEDLFAILEHTEAGVREQLSPAELHLLSELLDRMYLGTVVES